MDCENVGLNGLTDLVVNTDGSSLKFVLFHNSTNKINLSLTQLKDFGYALSEGRIELVELAIPEKMTKKQAENALDFYIAFYMGSVMPFEPFNSHCVILSKDHDYDPLILHVQKQFGEDRCERVESYDALAKLLGVNAKLQETKKPAVTKKTVAQLAKTPKKAAAPKTFDLQKSLEKAKANLKRMSKNRPTTKTKLQKSLKNWFTAEKLTDANIQSLIEALQKANFLELSENNQVKYK
ncbi:PIN domain-containing protein [Fibrobacter sp.]